MIMIGAMYENGGNTTHRLLDGHPELLVYPFESQLGNQMFADHLSSLFHFKYRWPEFPATGDPGTDYEMFFDEEMKVRVRTPFVSKFRDADLQLKDADRKKRFVDLSATRPRSRAAIVESFFQASFDAWTNLTRSGHEHMYVGYSPIISVDADRILADFPDGHVIHVVRNPLSCYAETKHRPFPHSLHRYTITWNLIQLLSLTYADKFPRNFHIIRYEDIVADRKKAMSTLCTQLGIAFSDKVLTPSWNGKPLEKVYPWGTIHTPSPETNKATADELSDREKSEIRSLSRQMMQALDYASW